MSSTFFKKKIKKRTNTILIPYLIFLCVGTLIYIMVKMDSNFQNICYVFIDSIIYRPKVFYQIWFLRDLYIMMCLSPLVAIICKKCCFLILIPMILWLSGAYCSWISIEAILFFIVGAFIALNKYKIVVPLLISKVFLIVWIIGALILTICNSSGYICPYFVHCILLIMGGLSLWNLYDNINASVARKINTWPILQYSFFIYLIHEPILTIIKKTFLFVLGQSDTYVFIIYILAPILTILFAYLIGVLLNKFCPCVLNVLTGNRSR